MSYDLRDIEVGWSREANGRTLALGIGIGSHRDAHVPVRAEDGLVDNPPGDCICSLAPSQQRYGGQNHHRNQAS